MCVDDLTGLSHKWNLPRTSLQYRFPDRSQSQQRWQSAMLRIHTTIADYNQIRVARNR